MLHNQPYFECQSLGKINWPMEKVCAEVLRPAWEHSFRPVMLF